MSLGQVCKSHLHEILQVNPKYPFCIMILLKVDEG
jgi:hypothetical protein